MNELDQVWEQMMTQAIANANELGNHDVAEYLALKASNDAIRRVGCQWLFDSFFELSEIANRGGIKLEIEREDPHRFAVGHSNMVGSLVRFHYGIRCLTIETGWTRTPADGFMRNGAYAYARISHFGISIANADLILIKNGNDAPVWAQIRGERELQVLESQHLAEHFDIFLDLH